MRNRTLLQRQGLLARTSGPVEELVQRLVGLQAQETRSPYAGIAARLDGFDPVRVGEALESRALVRMVCLRSTLHLLTATDALGIRSWTEPVQARELAAAQNLRPVRDLDLTAFRPAVAAALDPGPLSAKALGEALAQRWPDRPATALAGLARVTMPLVQLPPRGILGRSGGVVYQLVDRWLDRPLVEPDPRDLVRRYLAAFGPATPADVSTWSGVPGAADLLATMPDLVEHTDESGHRLVDVADGVIADEDATAPVRLLGTYDNLWRSHQARDRVTHPEARARWSGANGGVSATVFVDGWLAGLWRVSGRRVEVEMFGRLTREQRAELDAEVARAEVLFGA